MTLGIFDRFRKNTEPVNLEKLENRVLLKAIEATALNNSPDNRRNLFNILLDVVLLVPVHELPGNHKRGTAVTTTTEPLQLPLLRNGKGNKFIPVFSDLKALRNWDPNAPYIGLNSVDLFKSALGSDVDEIAINLFDPIRKMIRPGGTVTRQEFQLLAEGQIPFGVVGTAIAFELKPGQQIAIGIPAQEPKRELLKSLFSAAEEIDVVDALYLAQIASQKDQKWISQTLLGIELKEAVTTRERREQIVQHLSAAIHPWLDQHEFLDFTFVDGTLGQKVKAHGKLLYKNAE